MIRHKHIRWFHGVKMHHTFWWQMLTTPRSIGAIAPSSRFLARNMASQIDPHRPGWVIELGAGTGVVTRALLKSGIKPDRLMVIEIDRRLCAMLRKHFPDIRIVHGDAAKLDQLLVEHKIHKVNAIVSSLPLLIFPPELYQNVVDQMFTALPSGSPLVQFTYSSRSSIRNKTLKHHHAEIAHRGRVWLNLPPATVWRYVRGN